MISDFRREYLLRLPLPLEHLYRRAYNAKDGRSRHDNTFYLFEATIKLTAACAAATYLWEVEHGVIRAPAIDRWLTQLAVPSLGQSVGILHALARYFGERADSASHPLGKLSSQLCSSRTDLKKIVALYRRIKNGLDGSAAGDVKCSILASFDAVVQYRNGVLGHGDPRFE